MKTHADLAFIHSPVVASVSTVISKTLTTSTMTSRAPLLPIGVYRSLILGKRKRRVTISLHISIHQQTPIFHHLCPHLTIHSVEFEGFMALAQLPGLARLV